MMYSEFVEGTGCRENEHNYKVFQNLEIMYMNSNMTKAEVYEYGKKLVDNSKSERQIELERQAKAEIEKLKEYADYYKAEAKRHAEYAKTEPNGSAWKKEYKEQSKREKAWMYEALDKIAFLKTIIED